jgi:hypothetical protein
MTGCSCSSVAATAFSVHFTNVICGATQVVSWHLRQKETDGKVAQMKVNGNKIVVDLGSHNITDTECSAKGGLLAASAIVLRWPQTSPITHH